MATRKTTEAPVETVEAVEESTDTTAAENESHEIVSCPPDPWERVPLYIDRGDNKDDPNVLIGLNGVNYLLPRGATSMVPRCVAEEYRRSREANNRFLDRMADLAKQSIESLNATPIK